MWAIARSTLSPPSKNVIADRHALNRGQFPFVIRQALNRNRLKSDVAATDVHDEHVMLAFAQLRQTLVQVFPRRKPLQPTIERGLRFLDQLHIVRKSRLRGSFQRQLLCAAASNDAGTVIVTCWASNCPCASEFSKCLIPRLAEMPPGSAPIPRIGDNLSSSGISSDAHGKERC